MGNLIGPWGIRRGRLQVKYLGVPFITAKLSATDCKHLVDKITEKICSWGARHVPFAGRLQLIQSVLQRIIQY